MINNVVQNPVLPGFNPDPSILRVGDDFYLATSTFEWWPGLEIYHSKDLINWALVNEPLDDESLIDLRGVYNSGGIWAPNLSFADQKFWLTFTLVKSATCFKDTLNFVITSSKITGPWTRPHFINASGFDPSIFHENGHHYFLNMLFDHRLDQPGFSGVVIQEFNGNTLTLIGVRKKIFSGSDLGVCEGPQIVKKDGWYYLWCAAGGTGYSHAETVARSKNIFGPFSLSPYQPLISTKYHDDWPLQKCGHASVVQGPDQGWYIAFLCARPLRVHGNCPLGRETAIAPISWDENAWPHLLDNSHLPSATVLIGSSEEKIIQKKDYTTRCDFTQPSLPKYFKTLRYPLGKRGSLSAKAGYLRLFGNESLSSQFEQSLIARRWQNFSFRAETKVQFNPLNFQQMAGLVLFYDTDNWCYLYLSYDEVLHCRYLQIENAEINQFRYLSEKVYLPDDELIGLAVEVDHEQAQYFYQTATSEWQQIGMRYSADHLSDDFIKDHGKLAFTGAMVGICCQDMAEHQRYADFAYFDYCE
ncbi:glycoside hydrolase family 43 protein [Lapidilactobacillus luobeiensis]|uniref:glycoside hydrolase family 43 protein n=1 Tax=Lapidilactobacillus luobeiensis TaxID=2950371 RepID=UPI0021C339D0|nr:glycoside hydrolase family 43 protein [Lapidilactobacillus luobeiensis]